MRNITQLRSDLRLLRISGLSLLAFLVMAFFFAEPWASNTLPVVLFLFWLLLLGVVWAWWLYLLGRQAIKQLGQLRRDNLDLLEAHHHLITLTTDEQLLQNLVYTPGSILLDLVEKLEHRRRESLIRKASARLQEINDWLEANPEHSLQNTTNEDEHLWLEFRHEQTGLKELLKALKKNEA
jgi:hypothetical protein